jgi:hypothetical protein
VLQAASNEQAASGSGSLSPDAVSRTLHIQAAKVVAAHAASVGDNLLGVPLLCSAGESRAVSGTSMTSLHMLLRKNV